MDGLMRFVLSAFMILFFLLGTQNLNAENYKLELTPYFEETNTVGKQFVGNGREFIRQSHSYITGGQLYPIYQDKNGIEAYNFGMLVLEIRPVENYHLAVAWSVFADEVTIYKDLGITLLEFNDPKKAENAFLKLKQSEDPNITYLELALIELE